MIVASKRGLARDWASWAPARRPNAEVTLQLGAPAVVGGVVVDEKGAPIAGATVRALLRVGRERRDPYLAFGRDKRYIRGMEGLGWLVTKTDATGRFVVHSIPPSASAEFLVIAPGRARVFNRTREGFRYVAGRTDVRIALPKEARIKGRVVEKKTGRGVSGVRLLARPEPGRSGLESITCVSGADGWFQAGGLPAGKCTIRLARPETGPTEWLAEPLTVKTASGAITENVTIELETGGVVEVAVTDAANGGPLSGAYVMVRGGKRGRTDGRRTDPQGIAGIRLPPGDYRVEYISKEGYRRASENRAFAVTEGKTVRLSARLEITRVRTVAGVVRDPSGAPAAGVTVYGFPFDGKVATGSDGRFTVSIPDHNVLGEKAQESGLIAQDVQRNLAAVTTAPSGADSVEITLRPSVILAGRVTDPDGKGIQRARVQVDLPGRRLSIWGSSVLTDVEGRYQISGVPAVPGRKYEVRVWEADGFGRDQASVWLLRGQSGRVQVVRPLVLQPANLSISGVVVDEAGRPVPDIQVQVQGPDQPGGNSINTDEAGRFAIDGIIQGTIRVTVYGVIDGQRRTGDVRARAGDKGIRIVLGRSEYLESMNRPADDATAAAANRETLRKLQSVKLSPKFDRIQFSQALEYFKDVTGVQFAVRIHCGIRPRRAANDISLGTPVTLHLRDVTGEVFLQKLLKAVGGDPPLKHRIHNGTVFIEPSGAGAKSGASAATQPTTQPA